MSFLQKITKRFLDWGYGGTFAGNIQHGRYGQSLITSAGPVITEETALTIPAFLHAIRLYGQTLGSLAWDLYLYEDTKRSIARSHPIHRLIHDEPNDFQLPSAFRETMVANAISYGNSYAYIEHNGNYRATALLPLMPDRTYPTRVAGQLKYVTYVNNSRVDLEPFEVFHLPGFGTNGLTGLPLVKLMSEALGLTKAEESFAAAFFGNGANFGGVMSHPGHLGDGAANNLRQSLEEQAGGLGNAFKWIILEEGMTATRNDIDAEKSQLIQSRQYQLSELARIVNLTPHLLFDLSRSTNNNIEHQGIEAVTYSFKPWANKLCQEANRKLLYESEKGIYEAVIDLNPLMIGDAKTQAETDQIDFNMCALTPNERRAKRGLNPLPGGDQLFINTAILPLDLVKQRAMLGMVAQSASAGVPAPQLQGVETTVEADADPSLINDDAPPLSASNTAPAGPAVNPKMVEDANQIGAARALRPAVADVVARLIRRETKTATTAYNRRQQAPDAFPAWLATYTPESRQIVTEAIRPVCESVALLTGKPIDPAALAEAYSVETRNILSAVASQDDFDLTVEGWHTDRAERFINRILGEVNDIRN